MLSLSRLKDTGTERVFEFSSVHSKRGVKERKGSLAVGHARTHVFFHSCCTWYVYFSRTSGSRISLYRTLRDTPSLSFHSIDVCLMMFHVCPLPPSRLPSSSLDSEMSRRQDPVAQEVKSVMPDKRNPPWTRIKKRSPRDQLQEPNPKWTEPKSCMYTCLSSLFLFHFSLFLHLSSSLRSMGSLLVGFEQQSFWGIIHHRQSLSLSSPLFSPPLFSFSLSLFSFLFMTRWVEHRTLFSHSLLYESRDGCVQCLLHFHSIFFSFFLHSQFSLLLLLWSKMSKREAFLPRTKRLMVLLLEKKQQELQGRNLRHENAEEETRREENKKNCERKRRQRFWIENSKRLLKNERRKKRRREEGLRAKHETREKEPKDQREMQERVK